MSEEIETIIYTEEHVRISVDQWDNGGVWLSLQACSASMHTTLTRAEAEHMLKGLQAVLGVEVTA
jgi:hypothetical protein